MTDGTQTGLVRAVRRAGLVALLAGLGLLAKRDHDEQARIDGLATQIATLNETLHAARALPSPFSRGTCAIDSNEIEAIRRAVVAAMPPSTACPSTGDATAGAMAKAKLPPEPTAEQHAALAAANDVLEVSLRRKSLTRDDVTSLRRQLTAAGPSDEAQEFRARIAAAVNRGELVPDAPHFMP